jgi:NADH dehydrogenase/NADH:ubiquinone oxidoreductase subunit G
MIRLRIDGKEIESESGKTILEVARENGIYIPTLCYHERLLPIGSCRLCVVEIEGYDKPQTSCTTLAVDGISVITQSDRLFQMRQEFLKFILIGHPLDCPICDKAGDCKLQDLVHEHRIERAPYLVKDDRPSKDGYSTPLIRKWNKRCGALWQVFPCMQGGLR